MRKIANPTRSRRNLTFSRLGYEIISKKQNYSRTTQAKSIKKAVPMYNYKHGVSCLYSKTSTWVFDKTKSRRLKSAVATVSNALWYFTRITSCWRIHSLHCVILWTTRRHTNVTQSYGTVVLQMWAELMKEHADNLRELLLQTLIVHHQCLFTAVHQLSNGIHKYYNFLLQQHESNRRHHEAMEPIRSVENYLIDISAMSSQFVLR